MTPAPPGLEPIMLGAELITRTGNQFRLCDDRMITCDPTSVASLDQTWDAIIDAAQRMGIDGRVMFTAARRQLGDIVLTRAALIEKAA